jgi:hypothetical protein
MVKFNRLKVSKNSQYIRSPVRVFCGYPKNEIKTVMDTLDDSDSSITQLTTDIENIQNK